MDSQCNKNRVDFYKLCEIVTDEKFVSLRVTEKNSVSMSQVLSFVGTRQNADTFITFCFKVKVEIEIERQRKT